MRTIVRIAMLALAAGPALAQGTAEGPPMPMRAPMDPSMMAAMERMSKAMAGAPVTGDADQDFVAMMLPHHEGAVEMARFELAHGKDPALRRLARQIVAAQEREIGLMRAWRTAHLPKR